MRMPNGDRPALPATPSKRATRGGGAREPIEVRLKVVTPILGGAVEPRKVDEVDIIRVPTIRGHLRFWWRALYGHNYESSHKLYEAEKELWGGATDNRDGKGSERSAVEIRVRVTAEGERDDGDQDGRLEAPPGAMYAMWPAREETSHGAVTERSAAQWLPGTTLTLCVRCLTSDKGEVENTLRAWILFGGYGGRTRRGLGSLTVTAEQDKWLPAAATREAFQGLFGVDVFGDAPALTDLPLLAGAALHVGAVSGAIEWMELRKHWDPERSEEVKWWKLTDAEKAWTWALNWLRAFRQGTVGATPARVSGAGKAQPNQPSISNWPEPDKARHLWGRCVDHDPTERGYTSTRAWPRAGFGLPIHIKWQKSRRGGGVDYDEPDDLDFMWSPDGNKVVDRLASPLILKALPCANGQFVPIALWLHRGYPDGQVVIPRQLNGELQPVPGTNADFDLLKGAAETAEFAPLNNSAANAADRGMRLRTSFLSWLVTTHHTTEVAP